jgi:hypothetical protein
MTNSQVDDAVSHWQQGDCALGDQWFLFRFAPGAPLTTAALDAQLTDSDVVEDEVVGFVVVSQTCDVARQCGQRPFVKICPLVKVDEGRLSEIQRGRRPRYGFVPGVARAQLVADFDRVMTVEKGVVAGWEHTRGCVSDAQQRSFARALARNSSRAALPDDFVGVVSKLRKRLVDKHGKASAEGEALRALREIRVSASPSWDADAVEVFITFIPSRDQDVVEGEQWSDFLTKWLELVVVVGRYTRVDGAVLGLEDITAAEYVDSDPLDLDHLSGDD